MSHNPRPAQDPAEGSRETIERELRRGDATKKNTAKDGPDKEITAGHPGDCGGDKDSKPDG